MDWDTIIKTIAATGLIVSATAWLVRTIIKFLLERDLVQYRINLESQSSLAIKGILGT